MPDLVFKNGCFFNMNQPNIYLFKVNNKNKVWNMLTVNNKDTRTTPLTSLILNIVNIEILNIKHTFHTLFLCLSY